MSKMIAPPHLAGRSPPRCWRVRLGAVPIPASRSAWWCRSRPAGTTDLLGRIAAAASAEAWGANVVVENKSGAGGNIGAESVAKAPPDGYTLLLGTVGTAVTNQFLYKNMPLRQRADASRRWRCSARSPTCSPCIKSLPVKTAKEYVEYCKKQGPDKVSFGSPAIGGTGHLAMEYFQIAGRLQGRACRLSRQLAGAAGPAGRQHPQHHGQPAALPAAHPVGRAAGAGRQLEQALVRAARRADHRRAGLRRLRCRAVVVRRRARRHAEGDRAEAVGRAGQGRQVARR